MSGIRQSGRTPARATRLNPDGINVVVQRAAELAIDDARLQRWVNVAMAGMSGEVTVRLVDAQESGSLNGRYRGNNQATNVLAFPAERLPMVLADEPLPLGDLVLCVPVIAREAGEQGKSLEAHWAHMLIHGCLHLRGFDHVTPEGAEAMEAEEVNLMAPLGFPDPYRAQ